MWIEAAAETKKLFVFATQVGSNISESFNSSWISFFFWVIYWAVYSFKLLSMSKAKLSHLVDSERFSHDDVIIADYISVQSHVEVCKVIEPRYLELIESKHMSSYHRNLREIDCSSAIVGGPAAGAESGANQYTGPACGAKKCFIAAAVAGNITTTVNKGRRVRPMSLLLLDVYELAINDFSP